MSSEQKLFELLGFSAAKFGSTRTSPPPPAKRSSKCGAPRKCWVGGVQPLPVIPYVSNIAKFTGHQMCVLFLVFPDAQVITMVVFSVFPDSQVITMVGPSVFPDSWVINTAHFSNLSRVSDRSSVFPTAISFWGSF